MVAWLVAPWAIAPFLAGLLARRFGERRVWGAAMLGQAAVPALLVIVPQPWMPRTRPSSFKTCKAFCAVVFATPSSCARRLIEGSASPGRRSPDLILSLKAAASRK